MCFLIKITLKIVCTCTMVFKDIYTVYKYKYISLFSYGTLMAIWFERRILVMTLACFKWGDSLIETVNGPVTLCNKNYQTWEKNMQLFGIWDVFTYSYKSNSHACTMYCISTTVLHIKGGGAKSFCLLKL